MSSIDAEGRCNLLLQWVREQGEFMTKKLTDDIRKRNPREPTILLVHVALGLRSDETNTVKQQRSRIDYL